MCEAMAGGSIRSHQIATFVEILGCAIEGRTATYVSVPITTGRRYVDWLKTHPAAPDLTRGDVRAAYCRDVLEPNLDGRSVVRRRGAFGSPLIDPSAFPDVAGWSQADYIELWSRVIDRYAARVIFTQGWEYSRGCVREFLVAVRGQRTTLDGELLPLTPRRAIDLIGSAAAEMTALGLETQPFDDVLQELSQLARNDLEVK